LKLTAVLCAVGLLSAAAPQAVSPSPAAAPVGAAEARKIAAQAYTFAYPLVLMEMTRRANGICLRSRYTANFSDPLPMIWLGDG
jgi:hypothetical protein